MAQENNNDLNMPAEGQKHFENLEKALVKARGAGGANAKVGIGEICKQYHQIEPFLKKALPFIKWIPKYGAIISEALEKLMAIADLACPTDN